MTTHGAHPDHDDQRDPRARAVRCAADNEPAPPVAPDDLNRVHFERTLRQAVARVMREPARAPAAIRDRVADALREATADEPAARLRLRTWPLAAAAAILIAATLFFSTQRANIFGPESEQAFEVRVATFIDKQHSGCADCSETFARKMQTRLLNEAEELVLHTVGDVPAPGLDLSNVGYDFAGIGKCGVPGAGRSVHLMYRSSSGEHVSVFVQQYTGVRAMEEGRQRLLACKKTGHTPIVCWRAGPLILYVKSPADAARDAVAAALGAPDRS